MDAMSETRRGARTRRPSEVAARLTMPEPSETVPMLTTVEDECRAARAIPLDQRSIVHGDAFYDDVMRLHALVIDLGLHLTALCNHPENWDDRYNLPAGRPCPGCYDARDEFIVAIGSNGESP